MGKIKRFLRERASLILAVWLCFFMFFISFRLGNLSMDYFFMPFQFLLFGLFIYLSVSYYFFAVKTKVEEENSLLKEEIRDLKMKSVSNNKDIQDYFLLWVHQMKTPITVSKLLLQKQLMEDDEEKLRVQMMYIEQYTDMAINYLKLMKTNTDMDITRLRLSDVVKAVVKKHSLLFVRKGISFEMDSCDEEVISDTKWLGILIEQLLSNALKYTEKGKIKFYFEKEEGVLFIEDTGIGIRSEDIPKIFDKGYSGYNGRLNEKSSGLGLFLAGEIAKRLKLTISVESEVGKGSRFGLRFREGVNLTKL